MDPVGEILDIDIGKRAIQSLIRDTEPFCSCEDFIAGPTRHLEVVRVIAEERNERRYGLDALVEGGGNQREGSAFGKDPREVGFGP